MHLMYLFLAYPKIKPQLDALQNEDLAPRFEALRQDLVFMFEFAIPVVMHISFINFSLADTTDKPTTHTYRRWITASL